jgi:ribosomal protein S18 acetylase RimI-like enzyme
VFERFTDRARRVVVLAQEESRSLDHDYIGTEHLLLGLIAEGDGVGARALRRLDVSLVDVRARVQTIIGRGDGVPAGSIPFTPRAKKVLELSLRESRRMGHDYIGTEHILLGLTAERDGVAAQVLRDEGIEADVVRETVVDLLGRELPPPRTVRLRSMLPEEFDEYLGWAVEDYAAELERNGKAVGPSAVEASQASFASLLPDGIETPRQMLLIAEDLDEGQRVGVLWFGSSTDDPSMAWIYDLTVDEAWRGHGWGRAIMRAFEGEARARGYTRAGLNVYADNHIARRLYDSLGYAETARQLHKDLPDEDPPEPRAPARHTGDQGET